MKIEFIPSKELSEAYSKWISNGIQEFNPCKEAMAYITDTAFERFLETIQLVTTNVIAVSCIGELLIKYKDGKLDKKMTTKILIKYGLAAFAVFIMPIFFHKYL